MTSNTQGEPAEMRVTATHQIRRILAILCLVVPGAAAAEQAAMASQSPGGLEADGSVIEARREYWVTLVSSARIEKKLEELEADADADPETVRTYRRYRDRLAASADRQRRELAARGVPLVGAAPAVAEQGEEAARVAPRPGPVPPPRVRSEVERLDGELDASLAAFDGVLMARQDELAEEEADIVENDAGSTSSATAAARELLRRLEQEEGGGGQEGESGEEEGQPAQSGEETGRAGEFGEDAGGADGADAEAGMESGSGEEGAETAEDGVEGADEAPGADRAGGVEGGGGSLPPGAGRGQGSEEGSGAQTGAPGGMGGATRGAEAEAGKERGLRHRDYAADDDIVARQLREAAERETDPVLKEKLWKEYEAYRKGSRR